MCLGKFLYQGQAQSGTGSFTDRLIADSVKFIKYLRSLQVGHAGSAIFNSGDYAGTIAEMRKQLAAAAG